MDDFGVRFSGVGRLYGEAALERVRGAHVCVVGVGGVGSWAVEALARSGVGALTLIDLDEVCVANTNRQLHALDGQVGRPKVDVLRDRVALINPRCRVSPVVDFFTAQTAETLLAPAFDYVVDAVDNPAHKCLLLLACRERGLPVVCVGGAGGRRDPTQIQRADLTEAYNDALLRRVRRTMRGDHGWSNDGLWHVPCVFSRERAWYPVGDGRVEQTNPGKGVHGTLRLDCTSGYGTAAFVTGAFGFAAAAVVLDHLAGVA